MGSRHRLKLAGRFVLGCGRNFTDTQNHPLRGHEEWGGSSGSVVA
jgi:hypothetical protein